MGWFSVSKDDAIREIEKVNAGMTVIRETIRITGDEVVHSNKFEIAIQLQDCIRHFHKYENIVSQLDFMKRTLWSDSASVEWGKGNTFTMGTIFQKCSAYVDKQI